MGGVVAGGDRQEARQDAGRPRARCRRGGRRGGGRARRCARIAAAVSAQAARRPSGVGAGDGGAAGELQRVDAEAGEPPEGARCRPSKLTAARSRVRKARRSGRAAASRGSGRPAGPACRRRRPSAVHQSGAMREIEGEEDGEGLALAEPAGAFEHGEDEDGEPVERARRGRGSAGSSGASETSSNQAKARRPATAGQWPRRARPTAPVRPRPRRSSGGGRGPGVDRAPEVAEDHAGEGEADPEQRPDGQGQEVARAGRAGRGSRARSGRRRRARRASCEAGRGGGGGARGGGAGGARGGAARAATTSAVSATAAAAPRM